MNAISEEMGSDAWSVADGLEDRKDDAFDAVSRAMSGGVEGRGLEQLVTSFRSLEDAYHAELDRLLR